MGLSPAVGKKCWPRPFRFPRSRPKPASRTAEEPMGSQMLVQLAPKQPTQGPLEQDRSLQQGEKLVVNLETTPNQKRAELDSSLKSESAGKLAKQAAEGRPRPRPGDLIEIFRIGYEHWAIYVEDDRVVHLAPPCGARPDARSQGCRSGDLSCHGERAAQSSDRREGLRTRRS
uniref:LRAT domain-containing protein n=1 Tax=Molossus molossus TaxID=27622 RepID=A0A7J8EQZ4_MOLMO|nr:hypothetical protein HJG59_006456 [Molossus molossus]